MGHINNVANEDRPKPWVVRPDAQGRFYCHHPVHEAIVPVAGPKGEFCGLGYRCLSGTVIPIPIYFTLEEARDLAECLRFEEGLDAGLYPDKQDVPSANWGSEKLMVHYWVHVWEMKRSLYWLQSAY